MPIQERKSTWRYRCLDKYGSLMQDLARAQHEGGQRSKARGINQSFRAIYPEGYAITRRIVGRYQLFFHNVSTVPRLTFCPKTGFPSRSSSHNIWHLAETSASSRHRGLGNDDNSGILLGPISFLRRKSTLTRYYWRGKKYEEITRGCRVSRDHFFFFL